MKEAIIIDVSYSTAVMNELKWLMRIKEVSPIDYSCLEIEGDVHHIIYNFKFNGDEHVRPLVINSGLAAGYGGEGPRTALECMQLLDFEIGPSFEKFFCSSLFTGSGKFSAVIRKTENGIMLLKDGIKKEYAYDE